MNSLPVKGFVFLVFFLFISTLICGAWPTGITTNMPDGSMLVGSGFNGLDGSTINQITVGKTSESGTYNIDIAFANIEQGWESWYAEKTNNPNDSWNCFKIKDLIPENGWPGSINVGTTCPSITSDYNGRLYLTVRRALDLIWKRDNIILTKDSMESENNWEAYKLLDITHQGLSGTDVAVSRSGLYGAVSTQSSDMGAVHWDQRYDSAHYDVNRNNMNSWRNVAAVQSISALSQTIYWDGILMFGYDYPNNKNFVGSSCVVNDDGTAMVVTGQYDYMNLTLDYTTSMTRGNMFGVGSIPRDSWNFARLPFKNFENPLPVWDFSLTPYTDRRSSAEEYVYFIGIDYSHKLKYSYYNLRSSFSHNNWLHPPVILTNEAIRHPQADYYRCNNGQTYLIVTYDTDPPDVSIKSKVKLDIFDITNPEIPIRVGTPSEFPFEVASGEYADCNQTFPKVCVEKTETAENTFDIHVCWTNLLLWFEYSETFSVLLQEPSIRYRCFTYTP